MYKNIYFKLDNQIINCDKNNPRNVYKELFKRLILPLYLPLLILISSLNLLNSKQSISFNRNKILIFLFGILAITVSESSLGMVQNLIQNNIGLILVPIFSMLIIYSLTFYFNYIKNKS